MPAPFKPNHHTEPSLAWQTAGEQRAAAPVSPVAPAGRAKGAPRAFSEAHTNVQQDG